MSRIATLVLCLISVAVLAECKDFDRLKDRFHDKKDHIHDRIKDKKHHKYGYGYGYDNSAHLGLSLFSVVKFKNENCQSQMTSHGGYYREGLCFTSSECDEYGGYASGSCATGFGVCCVFEVHEGDVTKNLTYLQNYGFPNSLDEPLPVSYRIKKYSDDVCSLRLDFLQFEFDPPTSKGRKKTYKDYFCNERMTIQSASGVNYPEICGYNTGHHIYVEFGGDHDDYIEIDFHGGGAHSIDWDDDDDDDHDIHDLFGDHDDDDVGGRQRVWDIKTRQIECTNPNRPPHGCFQYLTDPSGQIKTFNYDDPNSGHLGNQDYTICIRRKPGVCCIQYTVCDPDEPMSLDNADSHYDPDDHTATSFQDSVCHEDYVRISGSSSTCSRHQVTVTDRYCGQVLNDARRSNYVRHVPICDCSPPFHVGIVTDDSNDDDKHSRMSNGVCLNYRQIGC